MTAGGVELERHAERVAGPILPGYRRPGGVRAPTPTRCGWSLCASQMRCTDRREMSAALAIARPVQCVASCGGSAQVSATTGAIVSAAIGDLPGLRVLSRRRPSTPASAKRCCQRQTIGRRTAFCAATCCTGLPPPRRAPRLPALHVSAAGCDPRQRQQSPCQTHPRSRIPSVPYRQNRTVADRCKSADWVRTLDDRFEWAEPYRD